MASFQLALALVIMSFWCATASPTPDGTVPPFSTQAMWSLMQKNSKALVDQNNVDRQAGAVPTGCYTLSTGQTVTIQSPNYPSSYPPNNNGMWSFTAANPASRISMTCSDFRLDSYSYSYMIITGQGLRRGYYGTKSPFTEVSGNNEMKVFFVSKSRSNYGFSCKVTALGCGRRNPVTRIVGGQPTTLHEYPWQVALTSPTETRPFCGGSIISDQWIMTAAHCVFGLQPSSVIVVIGEHNWATTTETSVTQNRSVSQIIVYECYNRTSYLDSDIALIKLTSPIAFPADNKIAPVCLPDAGNLYENVAATITGWGQIFLGGPQNFNLYEVDVVTVNNEQCQLDNLPYQVTTNMICAGNAAGGNGTCKGDSGGALVTYGNTAQTYMFQIGIDSWAIGCSLPNKPTVYTRVSIFLPWIATNTAGSTYLPRP